MAKIHKLETEIQISASAESFYDIFCNRTHHMSVVSPGIVKSVNLHDGEWGKEGSIIVWNFVFDGKTAISKEVTEDIDKEKHSMTYRVIEGILVQLYKSFKFILQVTPKDKSNKVRWTLEYEKADENAADPHTVIQMLIDVSNDVDAYLTKN